MLSFRSAHSLHRCAHIAHRGGKEFPRNALQGAQQIKQRERERCAPSKIMLCVFIECLLCVLGERAAPFICSLARMCLARGCWRISKEVALSFEHYARRHMLAFLGTRVDEQKIWLASCALSRALEKINLKSAFHIKESGYRCMKTSI